MRATGEGVEGLWRGTPPAAHAAVGAPPCRAGWRAGPVSPLHPVSAQVWGGASQRLPPDGGAVMQEKPDSFQDGVLPPTSRAARPHGHAGGPRRGPCTATGRGWAREWLELAVPSFTVPVGWGPSPVTGHRVEDPDARPCECRESEAEGSEMRAFGRVSGLDHGETVALRP